MPNLVEHNIARAIRSTLPRTKARMQALASVRWILATDDGRFVAVDDRGIVRLADHPADATVFDGRDNERHKLRFMETLFGLALIIVVLDRPAFPHDRN
jgi:hypothetical protein